jgi:murein DD-endopeptidase MepM/ murein hydrolase activator NlpD
MDEATRLRKARERIDPRTDFQDGFVWPASGRISGVYGSQRVSNGQPRRPHYGIDIETCPACGGAVRIIASKIPR